MKRIITILILILNLANASDESFLKGFTPDKIIVGGASYHYFNRDKHKYNEVHPSLGIEFENGISVIYVHRNSINNKSLQIAYSSNFYQSKHFDIGYRIGLASGYKTTTYRTEHKQGRVCSVDHPDFCKNFEYDDPYIYKASKNFKSGIIPLIALEINYKITKDINAVFDFTPEALMFGFSFAL